MRAFAYPILPLLVACDGEKPPGDLIGDEAPEADCPREPTGGIPPGDANGDGAVDLADVVVILRHVAEGGEAPACPAAIDLVADDLVELDDAFSLLIHLYEGGFSLPDDAACDGATPLASPECGTVEARFTDAGVLELRADVEALEGWSVAVAAEGCALAGASTAGTLAASVVDDPPGLRDFGYDATFLADGGAVSAVVLGFMEPAALPAGEWSPVLALDAVAGETCDCTLRLGTLTALGEPVESLAVASGAAWPLTAEATIDACAR